MFQTWMLKTDLRVGGIQQLRGQNFAIFWPFPPEREQKQTFLSPLPAMFCLSGQANSSQNSNIVKILPDLDTNL